MIPAGIKTALLDFRHHTPYLSAIHVLLSIDASFIVRLGQEDLLP
jgi:hypothetical protein